MDATADRPAPIAPARTARGDGIGCRHTSRRACHAIAARWTRTNARRQAAVRCCRRHAENSEQACRRYRAGRRTRMKPTVRRSRGVPGPGPGPRRQPAAAAAPASRAKAQSLRRALMPGHRLAGEERPGARKAGTSLRVFFPRRPGGIRPEGLPTARCVRRRRTAAAAPYGRPLPCRLPIPMRA
jgi:hypothetical protein